MIKFDDNPSKNPLWIECPQGASLRTDARTDMAMTISPAETFCGGDKNQDDKKVRYYSAIYRLIIEVKETYKKITDLPALEVTCKMSPQLSSMDQQNQRKSQILQQTNRTKNQIRNLLN